MSDEGHNHRRGLSEDCDKCVNVQELQQVWNGSEGQLFYLIRERNVLETVERLNINKIMLTVNNAAM